MAFPDDGQETVRGFTLIELLVVIAIIAVLSSIILASLSSARARGRDARRVADIKQLQLALELYYDANHAYPTAISGTQLTAPGFIPTVPTDPGSGLQYAYVALVGASSDNTICASYHLGTKLEVYNTNAGSPFQSTFGGTPGGTYQTGTQDGPVCSSSSWAGNADIPASSSDFNASNPSSSHVFDVRP